MSITNDSEELNNRVTASSACRRSANSWSRKTAISSRRLAAATYSGCTNLGMAWTHTQCIKGTQMGCQRSVCGGGPRRAVHHAVARRESGRWRLPAAASSPQTRDRTWPTGALQTTNAKTQDPIEVGNSPEKKKSVPEEEV